MISFKGSVISISVFLLLAVSIIACSSIKRIQPHEEVCSIDFGNYEILQYVDQTTGFSFFYPKDFIFQINKGSDRTEYRAIHKNGFHELSVTVYNSVKSEPTQSSRNKIVINQSTEIDRLEWRKLSSSKNGKEFYFTNGIAKRQITDSTLLKGLVAIDFYYDEEKQKTIIVQAIDYCTTSSSNQIESYFSLNLRRD